MTRTLIALFLGLYSVARLTAIGIYLFLGLYRLPMTTAAVTAAVSLISLLTALFCLFRREVNGNLLRVPLFLGAAGATANIVMLYCLQIGVLSNLELLMTGTILDPILFLGSCTLRIRDSRGLPGRSPFARAVQSREQQEQ